MDEIVSFQKILWVITILIQAGLAVLLLYRKNYRPFPLFFAYVLATLAQSGILVVTYRVWGFQSPVSMGIAWSTQFLVILVRGLAVAEICWRVLRKYRGIWALAWRLLAGGAVLALLYAGLVTSFQWYAVIFNTDRGLEFAVTIEIVLLFLFANHYDVEIEEAARSLAIGFFLYSCTLVLNDTIFEGLKYPYGMVWHLLDTLSFLASMLIWTWALRKEQQERTTDPVLLSRNVYAVLTPEINLRLKLLNDHLSRFWNLEAERP